VRTNGPAAALRLVIFDLDGTLVDSAALIVAAMQQAFRDNGRQAPDTKAIHAVIGLSLTEAVARLLAGTRPAEAEVAALAMSYRSAFLRLDTNPGSASALFPGVTALLEVLEGEGHLLAVATGKGRRGLDRVLSRHDLTSRFIATRTPDEAPGKPHPGMVLDLLSATGVDARDAVVVGDSLFDMQMAVNAGVPAIGVAWGSCTAGQLLEGGAGSVADRPAAVAPLVRRHLRLSDDPFIEPGHSPVAWQADG